MRNRSTKQLHSILEQPASPQNKTTSEEPTSEPEPSPASSDTGHLEYSGDMVKEAAQKVKQLCHHLELINDAYRDMKEQFKPLQDEYARRNEECRFLESQCRRLDVHCRLLEERAPSMDGGSPARSQSQLLSSTGSFSRFQRYPGTGNGLAAAVVGRPGGNGTFSRVISDSPLSRSSAASWGTLSADGSREVLRSPPVLTGSASGSPLHSAVGAATSSSASAGGRPWAFVQPSVGEAVPRPVSTPSPTLVPGVAPGAGAGKQEVPPRGLLYAASVSELGLDSQRPQGTKLVGSNASAPWSTADYIRRVASAPTLPAPQLLDLQAAGLPGRGAAPGPGGNMGVAAVPLRGPLAGGVGVSAEDEPPGAGGASASGSASATEQSSFDSSTFLSLAQQPGRKTAALQYLMSSTRNALGTIGEGMDPSTTQSPSKTPGTSPARSASVGSLGGLGGNINGLGSMPPNSVTSVTYPTQQVNSSVYGGAAGAARPPFRPLGSQGASTGSGSQGQGPPDFGRERLRGVQQSGAGFGTAAVHQTAAQSVGLPVRPAAGGLSGLAPGNVVGQGGASLAPRRQNSVGQLNNSGIGNSQLGGPSHRLG